MLRKISHAGRKKPFRFLIRTTLALVLVASTATVAAAAPAVAPPNYLLLRDKGPFIDPARCVATVDNPRYLGAGDLDGDGTVDFLAVPSDDTNSIAVHPVNSGNVGSGTTILVGHPSEHINVADVNGDGKLDILVAHDDPFVGPVPVGGFSIILGDGTANFSSSSTIIQYVDIGDVRRIIAGDFVPGGSVENQIDVALGIKIASDPDDWRLRIMQNQGSGTFTIAQDIAASVVTGLDAADIDGDGDLDLLTTVTNGDGVNARPGSAIVSVAQGGGTFNSRAYDVHYNPVGGKFVDVDGESFLDIVVGGAGEGDNLDNPPITDNVTYIRGLGDGTFSSSSSDIVSTKTGIYKSRGFTAADFNADGKIDIAITSRGENKPPPAKGQEVRVLFGMGDGNFDNTAENMLIYDDYWYATGIVAEDIDGDGDKDIIFTIGGNNDVGSVLHDSVCVLRNNMNQ